MEKGTNSVENMLFLVYWNVASAVQIYLEDPGIVTPNTRRLSGNV